MEDLFRDYWWLLFPIVGFGFAAFDRYTSYRRHRDNIELLKAYAAQGREPPPEVVRAASGVVADDDAPDGIGYSWSGRRRRWHRGPFADWRRVVIFSVLAGSFWFANWRFHDTSEGAFEIVAIIMTALAVAFAAFAVLGAMWKDR